MFVIKGETIVQFNAGIVAVNRVDAAKLLLVRHLVLPHAAADNRKQHPPRFATQRMGIHVDD